MNVLVVDDERIVLEAETKAVKRVMPEANVFSFQKAKEAVEFVEKNKIDIAFLDINLKVVSGLTIAKKLQEYNSKTNIIFCTGYSEYSLDALDLYCSAYLMKPITDEKILKALEHLRYQISRKIEGLRVRCFGNFEVYKDGVPIVFKQKKTKELLAYLIDRCGSTISTREMMMALYETDNKESYIRNLRSDLKTTFEQLGIGDALVRIGGNMGVNMDKIDCDYYEYLEGNKELFRGEYMKQYSFGEDTLATLMNNK